MRSILTAAILMLNIIPLHAGILINEISAGGSSDWIEIKVTEDVSTIDISSLFVTMYYGTNEKISDTPVTLRGRDNPVTPYDDRFAVIHFSSAGEPDETDSTGDIDGNGIRDLYCSNYGLWNTDCVIAIDTDDSPENGGIIDFAAFSNRDGTPNSTITGYMISASDTGEWISCVVTNPQDCMIFIGDQGLNSYSTLSRNSSADTNSPEDFTVTPYATPGSDNIINRGSERKKILKPLSDKIIYRLDKKNRFITIQLFAYKQCSLKVRIFNSAGTGIYSSDLISEVNPGYYNLKINESCLKGKKLTGLYPVKIEACADGKSDSNTVFLVIIRK